MSSPEEAERGDVGNLVLVGEPEDEEEESEDCDWEMRSEGAV